MKWHFKNRNKDRVSAYTVEWMDGLMDDFICLESKNQKRSDIICNRIPEYRNENLQSLNKVRYSALFLNVVVN